LNREYAANSAAVRDRPAFERYQAVAPHSIMAGYLTNVLPGHEFCAIVAYSTFHTCQSASKEKHKLLTPTESDMSWCNGDIEAAVESLQDNETVTG
jgi:hypothetical protein